MHSVLPTNIIDIAQSRRVFVILKYKPIFCTFPKVACSKWKCMMMRINHSPHWCIKRGNTGKNHAHLLPKTCK